MKLKGTYGKHFNWNGGIEMNYLALIQYVSGIVFSLGLGLAGLVYTYKQLKRTKK